MTIHRFFSVACISAGLFYGLFADNHPAFGQNNGNGNGNQNQGAGGIVIDANGLVRSVFSKDRSKRDLNQRLAAALKQLSEEMREPSTIRKVSLVQLEAACKTALQNGEELSDDLKYLAGINRIDFLFVDPVNNDILIAGPAEPYVPDALGRMVGYNTGRPPLKLDDLVVALRAATSGNEVGCSIDPQPEGLRALQLYVRQNSAPATAAVAKSRYRDMANVLGNQAVRLWGIPEDSHFAQALTEADLRMKRLSMGLDSAKVKGFRSYLSMLTPKGNSMQRWWFVPYYDAIEVSEDENAYQFLGQRAKLLAQEEVVDASGNRSNAAFTRNSTNRFAQKFTEKFPELAEQIPAFSELQNLIDLSVVSALIQERGLADKVGWNMSFFLDPRRMPIESVNIPKEIPSMTNYKMANRRMVIGLVGGGVVVDPRRTVRKTEFKPSAEGKLDQLHKSVSSESRSSRHSWWRN